MPLPGCRRCDPRPPLPPSAASARSNCSCATPAASACACATRSSAIARCRRCSSPAASPRTAMSPRAARSREAAGGRARSARAARSIRASTAWSRSTGSAPTAALDAPIDPADQADAIARCSTRSASTRLQAFVGCSYGAMVGLQFAARHGARLQQLVAISGAHRAHPYASAWRALQRRVVALGAAAVRRDPRPGAGAPAGDAELPHAGGIRRALRRRRRSATAACACGAEDYLDALRRDLRRSAPRRPPSCACPSRSTCSASIPARSALPVTVVAVAEDRLVPLSDACDAGRAPARRDPPARAAFAVRPRRVPEGRADASPRSCARRSKTALPMHARRCRHEHRATAVPPPCAPASTATPRSARSRRRSCCRRTSASPASARSASTTTRAAATRRATCSATRSPNSKAAPAASSPRPAWRAITLVLHALLEARRPPGRAARRLRRQLAAVQCAGRKGRTSSWSPPTSPIRAR